ncbi:MAG: MaoC/PaaZ C-terminal domain-containing protein [Candidatus Manganitrophus sp.]|nr:MAG: MaoC/PaaZ C-terminal domain-containing protein [Candidatus Manganitrophus sp.]
MTRRFFDDFEVGERFTTETRTITENDIVQFADLSGDHHRLHLDEAYAKKTPFGGRIAHGLLGLSIASGLWVGLGLLEESIIAFLGLEWKFVAPVRIGDAVNVDVIVKEKRASRQPDRGILTLEAAVLNQRNETVQEGSWTLLLKRRQQKRSSRSV